MAAKRIFDDFCLSQARLFRHRTMTLKRETESPRQKNHVYFLRRSGHVTTTRFELRNLMAFEQSSKWIKRTKSSSPYILPLQSPALLFLDPPMTFLITCWLYQPTQSATSFLRTNEACVCSRCTLYWLGDDCAQWRPSGRRWSRPCRALKSSMSGRSPSLSSFRSLLWDKKAQGQLWWTNWGEIRDFPQKLQNNTYIGTELAAQNSRTQIWMFYDFTHIMHACIHELDTVHCIALHYIALRCVALVAMRYVLLPNVTLHYIICRHST